MKKFLSRMMLFLLIFAMLLEPVAGIASAAETKGSGEGKKYLDAYIYTAYNPLYKGASAKFTATPTTVKAPTTNVTYYTSASSTGKEMRQYMVNRQETFTVGYRSSSSADIYDVLQVLQDAAFAHTGKPKEGDNLRWQWTQVGISTSGSYYEGDYTYWYLTYTYDYKTNLAQEQALTSAVNSLLSGLNLTGLTDYQKVYKIYDWMTKNIRYDYDHYYSDPSYELQYTAYAALVNRTCVCQGYANLFYRLALECGIDARLVAGGSGSGYPSNYGAHSWNIVQLNGKYYNLDTTWDEAEGQTPSNWSWFLLSDANFKQHYRDNGSYFSIYDGLVQGIDYTSSDFYSKYPMGSTNFDPNAAVQKVSAPTIKVSNDAATGKPKISWSKVSGATKYELYRATSSSGTYTKIGSTSSTSIINKSAVTGKLYYYKVKAVAADGTKSAYSNKVNRRCDLPRPVVSVTNVASTGKVKLSWPAIEGATKYELYRATSKSGTYTKIGATSKTSIINTSGVAGKLYYYKVKAIHSNSAANSAYSLIVKRTCDLPQPVVSVTNVASTGKVKLTWEKIDGAAKYEVYRATSKTGTYTKIYTTTGTTCINTSGVAGKLYYYKVRALHGTNSGGHSAYSAIVSRSCDLARPVVTVGHDSNGNVTLTWKAVEGAAKYEIFYSTSKTGTYTSLGTNTSTSVYITGTVDGRTYYFKVRALHGSNTGAHSAYSAVVSGASQ